MIGENLFLRPTSYDLRPFLHRVYKSLFNSIEDDDAKHEHNQHKSKAIGQARPGSVAGTEEALAEGFDDGGDGVEVRNPAPLFGDAGDGVDDGGAIHPQ